MPRVSKNARRKIPGTTQFQVSKGIQHSSPGLADFRTAKSSHCSTPVETKTRRVAKRLVEALDGNLHSMVKVGWGLGKMLKEYNKNQIEQGLPKLKQIEDVQILRLVEARGATQRANTKRYQARNAALASMGDFRAARKLKWSAPRMKALELWVRNGSIGRFEEKRKQEKCDDSEDLEEESGTESESEFESESEPELEPELKAELEAVLEDNIQVAGPTANGWTRKMALMPARVAAPSESAQKTKFFPQVQDSEEDMWSYPAEVANNPPDSFQDNGDFDFATSASNGTSSQLGIGFADDMAGNSRVLWRQTGSSLESQRADTSISQNAGTDKFLSGHFIRDYTNYGLQANTFHSRNFEPLVATGLEEDYYSLHQLSLEMQNEAGDAARQLKLAQDRADHANQNLLNAQARKSAHAQETYFDTHHEWMKDFR